MAMEKILFLKRKALSLDRKTWRCCKEVKEIATVNLIRSATSLQPETVIGTGSG